MRIALVTPGFSATEDDWCIPVLLNLVRELARHHEVHVFTLRYPHHRLAYRVGGATVHAFGGAEIGGLGRLRLLGRALRALRRQHQATPFHLVHGFWSDEPGFLAAASGRMLRIPSLVSVMGGELVSLPDVNYGGQTGGLNPWLTRFALRGAARVTVGSQYLQAIARQKLNSERLTLLPLGVDTTLFAPNPPNRPRCRTLQGNPSLISVGSLVPVKDHLTLLRAVEQVRVESPDVHLHVVGDGPLRSDLQEMARSLGIDEQVTFHGEIPHHKLRDYYRDVDLFVSSSRHESQGLAALESAACGCRVIGTSVGILPEISCFSGSIPPGDPVALANGIRSVLDGSVDLRKEGEETLRLVQSEFELQATVDRLLRLYGEIAGR